MTNSKQIFTFVYCSNIFNAYRLCSNIDSRKYGGYIDDSTITKKVKAAIFNESSLKSAEINVETFKGIIQLSGFVSSQADIDLAVKLTRNIKGVKEVHNAMKIKRRVGTASFNFTSDMNTQWLSILIAYY